MVTFGSLFAGVGGFDLGFEAAGWECRWQVEWDKRCRSVLARHWPDVARYGDVRDVDWTQVERVDCITAGFPCQPFSSAGLQRGASDDRYLWPEVERALGVLRPEYVVLENVAGLVHAPEFGHILGGLAALGFHAEWDCLPAAIFGLPHRRYRVFVVAHSDRAGCGGVEEPHCRALEAFAQGDHRDDAHGLDVAQRRAAKAAPAVRRMVDGMAEGLDEDATPRLRACGNGVAAPVAKWIAERLREAMP